VMLRDARPLAIENRLALFDDLVVLVLLGFFRFTGLREARDFA
jgi:hypothetical protein